MKSKKGFTLVEVLAVIVALSVIVLIAVNIVISQVNRSRKNAFLTDVQQFIKSTNYDSLVKNKMDEFVVYEFPNSGIEALSKSSYSGFMIKNEEEKVAIQIWNSGINMCAVKSFTDDQAQISSSLKTEEDCKAFLPNISGDEEISVKSLTGLDVDYKLKASCYTLDSNNNITNFNTSECGTVLIIPNKINGENVNGISDDFVTNAPKTFTSLYLIGVSNLTSTPVGFLKDNPNFESAFISLLPNLTQINKEFANNDTNIKTFYLTHCPKLTTLGTVGVFNQLEGIINSLTVTSTSLENIILEDLPKLEQIYQSFKKIQAKKIEIKDLDSLTTIYSSFDVNDGDTEVEISNNQNLTTISNGSFNRSKIKSMRIHDNPNLTSITSGAIVGSNSLGDYIDELSIYNNQSLTNIDSQAFSGYSFNSVKIYKCPNLSTIRTGAFGNVKAEEIDLSDLNMTTLYVSSFSGQIDKLIIPSTITNVQDGSVSNLNSSILDSIEFAGENSCSLIDLFRTSNGDGTYTYLVDENKLPNCP